MAGYSETPPSPTPRPSAQAPTRSTCAYADRSQHRWAPVVRACPRAGRRLRRSGIASWCPGYLDLLFSGDTVKRPGRHIPVEHEATLLSVRPSLGTRAAGDTSGKRQPQRHASSRSPANQPSAESQPTSNTGIAGSVTLLCAQIYPSSLQVWRVQNGGGRASDWFSRPSAVYLLAHHVEVSGVPTCLLDRVHREPTQRDIGPMFVRIHAQRVE